VLKYLVCPQETIKCGNEDVYIVNKTLTQETTKFISMHDICHYQLKSYTSDPAELDEEILKVSFEMLNSVDVYIAY